MPEEILIEFQDDFTLPFLTYHRILEKGGAKDGPLALSLYIRYIEQVKRQGKNETWSLDKFMIKNSGLEKRKFYKIKKILVDMKLIEQIKGQGSDIKVRVNFVIHKQKTLGVAIDVPTENPASAKNAPTETKKPTKAKVQQVHFSPGAEIAPQNNKEVDNININNDINKENIILTKVNIEQSSDFLDLGNLENLKNKIQEEVNSLSHEQKSPAAADEKKGEVKEDKRDPDINLIIETIKSLNGGITDDPWDKIRISGRNLKLKIDKLKGFNGDYVGFLTTLHNQSNYFYKQKFGSVEKVYWHLAEIIANVRANIQKQETPKRNVTFG